jgi:hypothetical protein
MAAWRSRSLCRLNFPPLTACEYDPDVSTEAFFNLDVRWELGFDPLLECDESLEYFRRYPEFATERVAAEQVLSIMRRPNPTRHDFERVAAIMLSVCQPEVIAGSAWTNFRWAVRCWHGIATSERTKWE